MNLQTYLNEYKKITEKIKSELIEEKYEKIDELLDKRADVVSSINKLSYKKDEFINIASEMKLSDLEREMNKLLTEKKDQLQNKVVGIKRNRIAANQYRKKFSVNPFYISKKIY